MSEKLQLSSFYGKAVDEGKLFLIQWGKNRSILQDSVTDKMLIVDNQQVMNLDEDGLIINLYPYFW